MEYIFTVTLVREINMSPVNPDSSIEYIKTDFHKKVAARLTPGKSLKHLRKANGHSQSELGTLVGDKKCGSL
jgi:hypothetical protein